MNGYDAQDMATQGADGFRNGYQAGYADAVKAIEAAQPAAAQEAVAWQRRYIGATRGDRPAEWHTITKAKFVETKTGKWANLYEVRELYGAPVTAAPVAPLTDTYVQPVPDKCDRIIWRGHYYHLPVNSKSTPAAPGIDRAALRARVVSAIERVTSGAGQMRIPADMTDPDLVLGDVLALLDSLGPQIDASPKDKAEDAFFGRDFYEEAKEGRVPWPDGTVSPKGVSDARDAALNTLAQMFHNSEEMEGPDGMVVSIDLSLWHEALEAYEVLIDGYDEVTLATSAQAQASDAEVRP